MNTQDQAQKTHLQLSLGDNHNSDIFEQNIKAATATPGKRSARIKIPPTPASLQKIAKRNQRTQLEMLQDVTNRYQAMDSR